MKLFRKSKDSQKSAKFEVQHFFFRILMEVLSKGRIRQWILPALPFSAHGRPSVVEPVELVEAIRYKLKNGCQWRLLPVKQFFTGASLTWQGVYARFNAWRKDGSWQRVWAQCVARKRGPPRLFQRPAGRQPHAHQKRGGGAVGYQGRKKARTTTALFLTDNRGQPLACASPWPAPARRRATTTTPTGSTPCLGKSACSSKRPAFPSPAYS